MHNIDLKQMAVFIAVADAGGLSAAQTRLGLGVSAISKILADLEVRVKCQLCERGRAGFRITQAGQRFYDAAIRFKYALDVYQDDVFSIHKENPEILRLGAVDNVLQDPNNPIVQMIQEVTARRSVKVTTLIVDPLSLSEKLLTGELDLILSHRKALASGCCWLPLYKEELVLVMGKKQHQVYQQSQLSLSQWIEHHGFCSFKSIGELREIRQLNFLPVHDTLELGLKNHLEEVLWQVLLSHSVAVLPAHFVKNAIQQGQVVRLSNLESPLFSTMYINFKTGHEPKPGMQDLLEKFKSTSI